MDKQELREKLRFDLRVKFKFDNAQAIADFILSKECLELLKPMYEVDNTNMSKLLVSVFGIKKGIGYTDPKKFDEAIDTTENIIKVKCIDKV